MDNYQICDKKANQVKECLSEILNIPTHAIVVYKQQINTLDALNRIIIKFGKYCYSIRKYDFYDTPIDYLVKDIISRYVTHIIDRVDEEG